MKENHGQPLRVLELAESPYFGGITTHLLNLADAFRGHGGVALTLATLPGFLPDDTLIEQAFARGHLVHEIPMNSRFDPNVVAYLRRYVHEQGFDLVHTHNYRATLLAHWAKLKVPVITTSHGRIITPSLRLGMWQWLELRALRKSAPVVVAVSDAVKDWLAGEGIDPDKVRRIHNGYCPPSESTPTREEARAHLGLDPSVYVVAYVGRLALEKGVRLLLDALSGMENVTGLVAGVGPQAQVLQMQARDIGLDCRFTGRMPNPEVVYAAADVVVLPSRMEALPMVLIEAAAHGVPVIASNVGGASEVVEDKQTGILFPYGELGDLRDAIEALRFPPLREAMGERARARHAALFSLEQMADSLYSVFLRAAGRNPVPDAGVE